MQVFDVQFINGRVYTRSFRVNNPTAAPLRFTATLLLPNPADLADPDLEITIAVYKVNDFGHPELVGDAFNWTPAAGAPQISFVAVARRLFLILDPSRRVSVGASIDPV